MLLKFWWILTKLSSIEVVTIYILTSKVELCLFPHLFFVTILFTFLLRSCVGNFLRGSSSSIFLMRLKFLYILKISAFPFVKCLHILYPFFFRIINSFHIDLISSLYIRKISPLGYKLQIYLSKDAFYNASFFF